MTDNTSIGDRMKRYEKCYNMELPRRVPMIIRIDGKSFHTLLRHANKPFDRRFNRCMQETCKYLICEVQGAKLAYSQSDEINLLVVNYSSINFEPYFVNELQKIVSVSASLATAIFNEQYKKEFPEENSLALFDSRVFLLPKEEVCNYFIWRQQDATRNSIQMVAQSLYPQKELQNKKGNDLQEMIFQKGKNWNSLDTWMKRGFCVSKQPQLVEGVSGIPTTKTVPLIDDEIPIFTQNRDYIERWSK